MFKLIKTSERRDDVGEAYLELNDLRWSFLGKKLTASSR